MYIGHRCAVSCNPHALLCGLFLNFSFVTSSKVLISIAKR